MENGGSYKAGEKHVSTKDLSPFFLFLEARRKCNSETLMASVLGRSTEATNSEIMKSHQGKLLCF
jgi:hypothetical protein